MKYEHQQSASLHQEKKEKQLIA